MSVCFDCGQEMMERVPCTRPRLIGHERIRYGKEPDDVGRGALPQHCGDCEAPLGGIHHFGCDVEVCPVCGRQAISCPHAEWFEAETRGAGNGHRDREPEEI